MNELIKLMNQLDYPEAVNKTAIPGLFIFRADRNTECRPIVYDPGIYILVQGHKTVYAGERKIEYDANKYLVTSVTIPLNCQTRATSKKPVMGLYLKIDIPQLHELIARLEPNRKPPANAVTCVNASPMDADMEATVLRLARCLQSEQDTRAIGEGIARELLYRVLCGEQAHMLHELANHSGNYSRIAHALSLLQKNFADKLDVDQLAASAHMSASAFHRAFKEMTSDSPIQYLKKLRLNKARDLMMQSGMKAYMAADEVGYESASQFSREFKRYFGQSPADLMREVRAA